MGTREGVTRRRLLQLGSGLGVALSGCLGQSVGQTHPTNESPTTTSTTESNLEVPPCPERPGSLTRETVVRFAVQFEQAYTVRDALQQEQDESRIVSIDITVDEDRTVRSTPNGWIVRFNVIGPSLVYYPNSSATTTLHADPRIYSANYYISETSVLRAESALEEAVDPRENGSTVQCPPE